MLLQIVSVKTNDGEKGLEQHQMWKQDHPERHPDSDSNCLSLESMQKEMTQVTA